MTVYKPDIYTKNIFSIDYDKLKELGVKYLVYDLDNTLGYIDQEEIGPKEKRFINDLAKEFTIIIASNNSHKQRVEKFAKGLNCEYIYRTLKPTRKLYDFIKKKTKNMSEVCVIGDQVVTDIIAGNRFGMVSVLIDPMAEKDLKITGLNRKIEKHLMKRISLKRGEYYDKK